MLRLFRRKPAVSSAARTLGQLGTDAQAEQSKSHRRKVREMANQMRAEMRAKGRADLPDIDWSTFS